MRPGTVGHVFGLHLRGTSTPAKELAELLSLAALAEVVRGLVVSAGTSTIIVTTDLISSDDPTVILPFPAPDLNPPIITGQLITIFFPTEAKGVILKCQSNSGLTCVINGQTSSIAITSMCAQNTPESYVRCFAVNDVLASVFGGGAGNKPNTYSCIRTCYSATTTI